jgi:hypothetical protein
MTEVVFGAERQESDRTPEQIIQSIDDQGKIVSDALSRLRVLLEHNSA